jgi:uncharacterized protein involved in exopolysaccharide biosynthesis
VAIEPMEMPGVNLFPLLLIVAGRVRLIAGVTVVGAALSALVAWRMPDQFTATAVIMPPGQQRPGIAALLGQLPAGVGALASGGDLTRPPGDLYMALLGSRSVADGVIADQELIAHYKAANLTQARESLAGRTRMTTGKDTLVRINVQDGDPKAAAGIANAYVSQLYELTSRFATTESGQRRAFYEHQLEAEKRELARAEAAMKAMQEKTGLVQVNSQVDAMIRSVAQLRAEIISREVQLEGLKAGATEQNPEVIRVRSEVASLKSRLQQMESTKAGMEQASPIMPAGKVPGAGLEYLRALRQLRYHESLYEALAKQHEAARIDEAKQAPVLQVVDRAVPPEIKSGPKRTMLAAAGGLSSSILACAFVLMAHALKETRRSEQLRTLLRAARAAK